MLRSLPETKGDAVAEDETVLQVETDKVTIDIRAPGAGILEEILVKEDDTVVVGQPVAKITLGAADAAAAPAPTPTPDAPAAPAAAEEAKAAPPAASPPPPPPPPPPAPAAAAAPAAAPAGGAREERRVKMTRIRKRTGERLKGSQNTYASLSTFNEIDMSNFIALRSKYVQE